MNGKKGLQIQNAKAHESHNSDLLIMNSWLIHISDEVCIYGPNHMDCHLSMANHVHGLIMKATHQDLGSQHLSPGDSTKIVDDSDEMLRTVVVRTLLVPVSTVQVPPSHSKPRHLEVINFIPKCIFYIL